MASDERRDEAQVKDAGRRALLKAATVAGGAVAAAALLPASWKKPAATVGGLPAHAQTSGVIKIDNELARSTIATPGALLDGVYIDCECNYEDSLGEFGKDHKVTFQVYPGILPNTSAQMAKNANGCGLSFTYALSEIDSWILGPPPTTHEGNLKFRVNSSCFPPGHIAWYLHTSDFHRSNWVNTSIEIQFEEEV